MWLLRGHESTGSILCGYVYTEGPRKLRVHPMWRPPPLKLISPLPDTPLLESHLTTPPLMKIFFVKGVLIFQAILKLVSASSCFKQFPTQNLVLINCMLLFTTLKYCKLFI